MILKLITFASVKDRLGDRIEIEISEQECVDDLKDLLMRKYPEISDMIESSRIATGDAILEGDHLIADQKELFLLPPSSGG